LSKDYELQAAVAGSGYVPADAQSAFLVGGGEMGALMRQRDWANTPLGAVQTWPQSLRTAVGIILSSRYAMFVWWGHELVNLYNDAYRPFLGKKHPEALGQSARVVWSEIWDQIGPRTEAVLQRGEATFDESLLLPMDRHGYLEETYFTFSYSPIRDDHGDVGGIFCAVTEDTSRIIGERRLKLLREVATAVFGARTPAEVCTAAASCIAREPRGLPFALLYLTEDGGKKARLVASAGIGPDHTAATPVIELAAPDAAWPLAQASTMTEPLPVDDLPRRFDRLPTGAWDRPPAAAVVVALSEHGTTSVSGFLIAGLNPYLAFDEAYRGFVGLLAGQIASGIANARTYEKERKRAEALAEIDRAKTAFFSNVSHEFRTPLTLMLGPLEDALADQSHGELPQTQRIRLEIAHRNSLRLLRLVNTLLDFSRIEAGRIEASYQPTDVAALTIDLASGFRSATDRAGLTLEINCGTLPHPIYVDRDMWEKLVLNLLSNAFKFTFEGGITVTLDANDDSATLCVCDTGVGIPADELPRVFERFHRIEGQQRRSFEGSGIGLALVQELVRLHGGTIAVQSTPDKGTAFTVTIPFGTGHLPPDRIVTPRAVEAIPPRVAMFVEEALRWLPDTGSSSREAGLPHDIPALPATLNEQRRSVLVVDDNADMRDYVCRLLGGRYDVISAADGQSALDLIIRLRPDLVLSDVMMPGIDGFGMLRAIRDDPSLRDTPVVLLSARAGDDARVEGLDAGADDYLFKPVSARELYARVGSNLALAQLRREAARAALDSAERLRQMFEQAPGLIAVLRGPDHVFELINAAYLRFIDNRDVLGKPVREAFPEVEGQGHFEWLDEAYRTGQPVTGNGMSLLLQRGPERQLTEAFIDFVYQPIKDGSGTVSRIFVEGFDVTGRVLAERALLETNETLEARVAQGTAELRETLTQLQAEVQERARVQDALRQAQKMEAVGQLTGGLAHDFNNLLTGIVGSLELLKTRVAQGRIGDLDRYIIAAQGAASRAASLTHRLLAFARRQTLDPKVINPNKLITDMQELVQRTVGPEIQVETVLAIGLWPTLCDPNQLENALLNLCINARDAMPDGGRLTIETANTWLDERAARERDTQPDQYVAICVTDTGTGMPPEVQARAFDPFFTTKPNGQGTGLGLSMIYGFAQQSGGHVRIYSEEGAGTTVRIYLPRHRGDADGAEAPPELAEAPRAEAGQTVLVVDDEPTVRMLVAEVLKELGYAVIEAADGGSGLTVLQSDARIDLLVTDVGLPGGVNGRQLADAARQVRPALKVLFMTGYATNAAVGNGHLELGMHVITKPFAMEMLANRINAIITGR